VGRATLVLDGERGLAGGGFSVSDDGEVLRFRPRGLFENAGDDPGPYGAAPPSDWFADERAYGCAGLGELTRVVLAGDQVVDVVREPVSGSGYECAVLELRDRGLLRPPRPTPPPVPPGYEQQLAWLARIVGGEEALGALDVEPLEPEAELCLDDVRPSLRDRVRSIDVRLEQWAPVLLGDEGPAATRRMLTRAVALEPALLRSDRDDVATGAVLWAVAKGNDLVGTNRPVRAGVIQEVCGLVCTPSARGSAFAHAVSGGGEMRYGRPVWMYDARPSVVPLGSPDLLLSRFRRTLVALRDISVALRAGTREAR
jgi:hypothetical protein